MYFCIVVDSFPRPLKICGLVVPAIMDALLEEFVELALVVGFDLPCHCHEEHGSIMEALGVYAAKESSKSSHKSQRHEKENRAHCARIQKRILVSFVPALGFAATLAKVAE
jgi:hypothetical protein